jgi:hypothetical protein
VPEARACGETQHFGIGAAERAHLDGPDAAWVVLQLMAAFGIQRCPLVDGEQVVPLARDAATVAEIDARGDALQICRRAAVRMGEHPDTRACPPRAIDAVQRAPPRGGHGALPAGTLQGSYADAASCSIAQAGTVSTTVW